ncbi:MAG: carboxypeptidase-like regulatory domain-containing protein [Bryobacteraceae bacterium]
MRLTGMQCVVALALALLAAPSMLIAQIGTGQVNGTVTDPQGASVPAATVRLVNTTTNVAMQVTTNSNGYYVFANVRPGNYQLSVEMQGFRTAQLPAFDVGVNQTATLDVRLTVGSITETIQVTAEAEMLQQSSAELGTVISEAPVVSLPLNGRNFTQLLTLTPGASPIVTAQGSTVGSWDGNSSGIPGSSIAVHPSMNGQFGRSVVFFIDGIINTDFRVQTYAQLPNIDLIQEFKVQSHNDKVEFGGVTGGVALPAR